MQKVTSIRMYACVDAAVAEPWQTCPVSHQECPMTLSGTEQACYKALITLACLEHCQAAVSFLIG